MSIGQRLRRPDATEKVRGRALFVGDLPVAGALHAAVLRSPHPHARIARLDVARARALPGVRAVLVARDIPGQNVVPGIQPDWPVLAQEFVRHVGEPVALVAAESAEVAAAARAAVVVEYQPLPATLEVEEALAAGEVMAHFRVDRGEAEIALSSSGLVVVEGTYETPGQEHAYLEPNGMIAFPDGTGGWVVRGSTPSPFVVRTAVASALGVPLNAVRVVAAETGGSFGGKEDAALAPAIHAALLARATGRPVRLVYSRDEDMAATSKRHPSRIRVRTGATPSGHLLAASVEVVLDGGAYATLSPLVLHRAALHACGPYRVPNVRVDAKVVRTHRVPSGAFRGFGVPQVAFAWESQMDRLAERLAIDPLELRRRNALAIGDETITGQALTASVGFGEVLDKVAGSCDWQRKRALFAKDQGPVRRGIGLAASHDGVGLGPLGREHNATGASVVVAPDGSVLVATSATEVGQGSSGALAQIAAEALGCPVDLIRVVGSDSSRVADGGSTGAGLTTVMGGNAVRDAAARIRSLMEPVVGGHGLSWKEAVARCFRSQVGLCAYGWAAPVESGFDLHTGQGEAYPGYSYSACAAEVEVDMETGVTRVTRLHSAHDLGRLLNPVSAEGQVEGGVLQGVGFALLEEVQVQGGRVVNGRLSEYLVPTVADAPEVRVAFVEHALPSGPHGAKGLGGATVAAVAPAIIAAIRHAAGIRLDRLPATPERVFAALCQKASEDTGRRVRRG